MVEAPRTAVATEALRIGAMFMMHFKDTRIGASISKVVKVMDPEQSTDGGRQARQPIALAPVGGEAASITIGWMDVAAKKAAFKDFDSVSQTFAQRTGMQLDFNKIEYEQVLASAVYFLQQQGLACEMPVQKTVAGPAAMQAAGGPAPAAGPGMGFALMLGCIGVAVGFGLGYVVFGM